MPTREELLDEIREVAREAHRHDRYPAVVELLHEYLKQRPGDGHMWFLFGDSLRAMGLREEAESALHQALELSPEKWAWMKNRLARLHHDAGRHAEAERYYAEVCLDPEFSQLGWLWIMRGANLAAATQLRPAEACHRQALTFDDQHVDRDEAYLNLGLVLRAQGRYAEAAEAFQNALAITPDYPEALEARDSLLEIDKAIALTKQVDSC